MTVKDAATPNFRILQDCWFPNFLNGGLAQMTPQEQQQAEAWINANIFDAALVDPHRRMNVTDAVRRFIPTHPDWTGSVLQPLYAKTGQDEVRAARLYGNLVCRIGIGRPETWWSFPQPVSDDQFSRTYVLESQISSQLSP
jgi:hypothetical protein